MYINTNITSPAIAGFGPAAWLRGERNVSIHRARHPHGRHPTDRAQPVDESGRSVSDNERK